MSQTNNTTVFVFGAGVSAPAGFPLSKGLFSEFKDYISQRAGDDFYDALRGQWKELEERKVFDSWLDIETNLTRLDIEGRKDQDLVYLRGHIGDAFTEYFNEKHRQILFK